MKPCFTVPRTLGVEQAWLLNLWEMCGDRIDDCLRCLLGLNIHRWMAVVVTEYGHMDFPLELLGFGKEIPSRYTMRQEFGIGTFWIPRHMVGVLDIGNMR